MLQLRLCKTFPLRTNNKRHSACTKVALQIYIYRYKQNKYLYVCFFSVFSPLLPSSDFLLLPGRTSTCAKFPVIASFSLIAAGGNAWQSWRWWPCCLSLRGRACWGPYRSPCKQKIRRRCSYWAAKSLWICIRPWRLSKKEKPGEETERGRSVNLLTVAGWTSQHMHGFRVTFTLADSLPTKHAWGETGGGGMLLQKKCPFPIGIPASYFYRWK